jgi:hypothetical protein
MKMIFIKT